MFPQSQALTKADHHHLLSLQRQECLVLQLDLLAQEEMVPGVTETEITGHPGMTTTEAVITTVVSIVIGVTAIEIAMDQVGAMMTDDATGPGHLRGHHDIDAVIANDMQNLETNIPFEFQLL